MSTEIRIGSVWREDDKRFDRTVMVVVDGRDPSNIQRHPSFPDARAPHGKIGIASLSGTGRTLPVVTYAKPERFGKAGGYKPKEKQP